MATELRIQEVFTGMNGKPVTMYECEHLTTNTYRLENGPNLISTGDNTCVMLCAHCMTHLRGLVLADLMTDVLRQKTTRELLGDEWIEKALETRSLWENNDAV